MWRMFEGSVPAMRKLAEDFCAVRMDSVCDFPQHRNNCGIPGIDKAAGHLASGMNGLAFKDYHSDPAARALLVIRDMCVGWLAFKSAQGSEVRLENEPIPKFNFPDPKRAE
jgi:hypothetical protein